MTELTQKCSKCGATFEKDADVCPVCGHEVKAPKSKTAQQKTADQAAALDDDSQPDSPFDGFGNQQSDKLKQQRPDNGGGLVNFLKNWFK